MKIQGITIALLLAATSAAHAGKMLGGSLYRIADGQKLEFEIEKSRGTGKLSALDNATGETFEGQYSGVFTGQGTASGRIGDDSFEFNSRPTGAVAEGILIGSKGTVIEIELTIKPGFRPTGFGTGRDNTGREYRVIF